MFQKILACTDGSSYSIDAVEMAATLASKFHAEIKVLSVFSTYYAEPAYMGVWTLAISQETLDECAEAQRREIDQLVKPFFERQDVSSETLQERGHPADCIVEVAKREQSDLIVLGSRGLGAFKSLLLGSVSDSVLHHASCSVLILRGDHASHKPDGFKRILLATDGSEKAGKATHAALSLAQKFCIPLTVLNVFELSMPLIGPPVDGENGDIEGIPATIEERKRQTISQEIHRTAQVYGVLTSIYQEMGNPAEVLVRFAEEHHFDLIVLGCRGLGTFKSLLLGSVSDKVAHHAHCPILVVR